MTGISTHSIRPQSFVTSQSTKTMYLNNWQRERSLPPSPIQHPPILSPQSMVATPLSSIRFQREVSEPPFQKQYQSSRHLKIGAKRVTTPIQMTFALPQKKHSISRTEVSQYFSDVVL